MSKFARKLSVITLVVCSMTLFVFCSNSKGNKIEEDTLVNKQKEVLENVRKTIKYGHYSPARVNDDFSKKVYDKYVEDMDPFKRFFLQSDIDSFSKYRKELDNLYNDDDDEFFTYSMGVYKQRIADAEKYVTEILKEGVDLKEESYWVLDEDNKVYPKTTSEAKEEWRNYIKYNILQEVYSKKVFDDDDEDEEVDEKKIAERNKEREELKNKTDKQIEEEAIKKTKEDLLDYFRRLKLRKQSDLFSGYVNAFAETFDPHTTYFSPKQSDDFNSSMSGSIIGIGALLQDKKGVPEIKEVIVGGPAWKSKKVEVGDKIMKVRDGKNGKDVSVVGMLLDDAVRLIRGKEGSTVVLTLENTNGQTKQVELKREQVEMQETFVRSAVTQGADGNKYGIIYLPEFYVNLQGAKGRDCSDDVAREVAELKKENVRGIILDVRTNGGGSLAEVVDIAGLFLGKDNPVVQVKNGEKKISTLTTKENLVWDGSLVVMVNEFSASASEILAGVLQDYKRALILGSEQTYGKGTVQAVYPLDRFSLSKNKLGDLKLTIQKFYRVSGSSTQLEGVKSDIVIPDSYSQSEVYERNQKNPLAWDEIPSLEYTKWRNLVPYDILKSTSKDRLSKVPYMNDMSEYIGWLKESDKGVKIPLKYDDFFKYTTDRKDKLKAFKKKLKYSSGLKFNSLPYEVAKFEKDNTLKEKRTSWNKLMEKDFNLKEAISVLEDMQK